MVSRRLGKTEYNVSAIGFGAFKIGRNTGIRYPAGYELPDDRQLAALLDGLLELGVTLFDTAPAYGDSEDRLGRHLAHAQRRNDNLIISTKVGERFHDGQSTWSYTARDVRTSLETSLRHLRVDMLDLVFVHSNGDDMTILRETDVVATLLAARDEGLVRRIGFSGKTVPGARAALDWVDALMIEYHRDDRSHLAVMNEAKAADVGIIVKKALASGHHAPREAIPFALAHPAVSSLVIGGLNLDHFRENIAIVNTPASP